MRDFYGTLNRLTGDLAATKYYAKAIDPPPPPEDPEAKSMWTYSLKCKPTQRMF